MTSNYLSFTAAVLAFPSVAIVGLSLLMESWGNLSVKLPNCLVEIRTKMANNRGKWNTREFYMRFWGFLGASIAIILQVIAVSIKIWG